MGEQVLVVKKEQVLSGRIFDLERQRLRFSNGHEIDLEIVRHPGASAVVPLLEDGTVLLIRQYRHAVAGEILEIPAGTLKGREDPLICAQRELEEETGYYSTDLVHLGMIYPLPGYSDERIYIYLARNLKKTAQHLDEDEIIGLEPVSLDQILRMIREGLIVDAKSICGLFMALAYLRDGNGAKEDFYKR